MYCIIIITIGTYQGTIGTTGGTHRYFIRLFSEILPVHWRI